MTAQVWKVVSDPEKLLSLSHLSAEAGSASRGNSKIDYQPIAGADRVGSFRAGWEAPRRRGYRVNGRWPSGTYRSGPPSAWPSWPAPPTSATPPRHRRRALSYNRCAASPPWAARSTSPPIRTTRTRRPLAYLARARGYRTAYLSLTRGDGGQNLLGPQLGEALGVARTQELLAARRLDGGRQYFTRAKDFGYSKNAEETLSVWDRQAVLGDIVRVIREFRPDVIITRFSPKPAPTHGHHTASAVLAVEAFRLAADPAAFPEQLPEPRPWQARRIVHNVGLGAPAANPGAGMAIAGSPANGGGHSLRKVRGRSRRWNRRSPTPARAPEVYRS
jgi:GlcNAc-PI de-N-acetylase